MACTILFVAGLFAIVWAVGLRYTEACTRLTPSLVTVTAMVISMALLGFAMRTLPVGTAYAIWTGMGSTGAVMLGIFCLAKAPRCRTCSASGLLSTEDPV